MKLKFVHIIGFAGLLLTFSCNGCNKEPACDSIWVVEYINPSLIAEIDSVNKTMSMQVPSMANGVHYQGEVYQSYFNGNFNAVANFSNFIGTTGPGRPYAEMIMYNSLVPDTVLDTSYVRAGISSTHIYTHMGLQKDEKIKLPTTTSGKFQINRIGNDMFGQVIAAGDTVTLSLTMPFTPIRFAFRLGSMGDSAVSSTTAIKITSFQVSGTSDCTLLTDQFKCNSIYIP